MLVLTRKLGESVVIHEDLYCTVVACRNGNVRLAFDAPKSIPIHRDEIQRRIQHERRQEDCYIAPVASEQSVVDRLINKFKTNVA